MQTLTDSSPTGAVYGIHAQAETRADPLPALDVENLVGAFDRDQIGHTEVTPLHFGLLNALLGRPLDVLLRAFVRDLFVHDVKLFESTPSTMESVRARIPRMGPVLVDPPAYVAFKTLGRWLDADDAAVADMVGIGRTTAYTWKREGREPRAATAQRIYEHYSTLDSLSRRLGIAGLRRWLYEGIPTRRDVLLAGNLERLESDIHAVLFHRAPAQRIDLAASPEDSAPMEEATSERPLRPSGRRPRRASG